LLYADCSSPLAFAQPRFKDLDVSYLMRTATMEVSTHNGGLQKTGADKLGSFYRVSRPTAAMNTLIFSVSHMAPFRFDLDYRFIRAAMVFTFLIFGYQKWFGFEANQIEPFISHSPLVFWLIPAFGVRGAGFFLGTTEWLFGTLIFLGFWNPQLGILGALGSSVTFLGTVTIIPLFPSGWAAEAGGFPAMYLPIAFLVKDVLFLAASFYLLKQDLMRAALEISGAPMAQADIGENRAEPP
jgi:uncharacterized membrane protein YkgB